MTQRLASAIVALARPPPGGMTWSSRSRLELADERRERCRCWRGPSRPDRRRRSARRRPAARSPSGRSRARARSAPSPRRRRVRRRAARRPSACPGARAQPADGDPLDRRPVDEAPSRRPLGVPADDASPRPRAPTRSRKPACQARSSRHDARGRAVGSLRSGRRSSPPRPPSSTGSTSGNALAEQPRRRARGTSRAVAGRELRRGRRGVRVARLGAPRAR